MSIDDNGRYVILDLHVLDHIYRLINIYAPNNCDERQKIFVELND